MKFRALAGLGVLLASGTAAWAQQYLISTFAGGAPPPTPIAAVNAPIGRASAVATDATGNVYFISDNCVFKLEQQNGVLTRVAGNSRVGYSGDGASAINARLSDPRGVAVDGAGNLFITDSPRIRKISSSGIITTVAGDGGYGYSGDGGPAINARLYASAGVAVDRAGNVFFADGYNNRIRKVSSDGIVSTVAGNGSPGYSGDGGQAINAQLTLPGGVAVDGAGNVYFADPTNHAIRRLQPEASSPTYPFTLTDRGGTSLMTAGIPASISVGYARIQPDAGSTTPSGLAIFGFRQNNILVSETGVPASLPLTSGRI